MAAFAKVLAEKWTALYVRLSRDDEKSKGHKLESLSTVLKMVSFSVIE